MELRNIYKINSRNLSYGIYVGPSRMGYTPDDPMTGEFIGLREKFNSIYPSSEWGRVEGKSLGVLPDEIELDEYGPSVCGKCGGVVEDFSEPNEKGIRLSRCNGPCDDQKYAESGLLDIQPGQVQPRFTYNKPLQQWLEDFEDEQHSSHEEEH